MADTEKTPLPRTEPDGTGSPPVVPRDIPRRALVVDDDEQLRAILKSQLQEQQFDVVTAGTSVEAAHLLTRIEFAVALCDVGLPDGSGLDLALRLRALQPAAARIIITGGHDAVVAAQALSQGVDGYLVKPFGETQLRVTVDDALARRAERNTAARGSAELERLRQEVSEGPPSVPSQELLERLLWATRFRDEETAQHVGRMSRTCSIVARQLGWDERDCAELRSAATLHDVGKVGVPDSILLAPRPLLSEERAQMQTHTSVGRDILAGSGDELIELAATIAWTHHERVDGDGYPRGLRGDDIPLAGRVAAAADVLDALTHERAYRPAFGVDEAVEMMTAERGRQFDADVLDALFAVLPEVVEEPAEAGAVAVMEPREVERAEVGERPIRVLLVEDHEAVARGLELVLRREGLEVVGTAGNLERGRALLERRGPDVAIIDIDLNGESGFDLLATADEVQAGVLLYTGRAEPQTVARARASGVLGIASKEGSPLELVAGVQAVARGETYIDVRLARMSQAPAADAALTKREREIVSLLAEGLSGEDIAAHLFLSPETVRTHIRNAKRRLGARTRAHLMARAAALDLIHVD